MGMTEVHICSHNELKSELFATQSHQNHEHPQSIMEKTAQTTKRCRHSHQTDFHRRMRTPLYEITSTGGIEQRFR